MTPSKIKVNVRDHMKLANLQLSLKMDLFRHLAAAAMTASRGYFLQAGCSPWYPTNSVKALKANGMLICWVCQHQDVDITQQVVAIYPQPLVGCKPEPTVMCENCCLYVWKMAIKMVVVVRLKFSVGCNCRLWAFEDWGQDRFAGEAFVRPRPSVVPKLLVTHNSWHPPRLKAFRGCRTTCYNYQVILTL